ncbi:hypothetical protein KW807_01205 [Candidatus Parcubacteria bacterium]|nr:hypothetical protein [Candidatus Parcubacteria bacterium]
MTRSSSMDYWFSVVFLGDKTPEFVEAMFAALHEEAPSILSVVAERACSLQCAHCIFQAERSSKELSEANSLTSAIRTIVGQMGENPIVVHEGRIFRPWHLDWMTSARACRPDALIGMIDSGSFLDHSKTIERSGFQFDWLDVSIDGTEQVHNLQRKNSDAFRVAIEGIRDGHRFLKDSGRINSLFTLTNLNFNNIVETCKILPKEVIEWHTTTVSPVRQEIKTLTVNDGEMAYAWPQVVLANKMRQVFVRIYVVEDILKLAKVVGKQKFIAAFSEAEVSPSAISFTIDGVSVTYYPQSVATSETFVIDADAHYRAPYSVAYSLEELRSGVSRFGDDLRDYTIGKVDSGSDFYRMYGRGVLAWSKGFGPKALTKETSVFRQIHNL